MRRHNCIDGCPRRRIDGCPRRRRIAERCFIPVLLLQDAAAPADSSQRSSVRTDAAWGVGFDNTNIFTGWCDMALTQRGVVESIEAGQVFASHELTFRKCYSSLLTRAIVTAQRSLEAGGISYIVYTSVVRLASGRTSLWGVPGTFQRANGSSHRSRESSEVSPDFHGQTTAHDAGTSSLREHCERSALPKPKGNSGG